MKFQNSIFFKNAVINSLKSIIAIFLPFATMLYITRVFQVESIGKISFAESVLSYFVMFAGLGCANYAIREGSAYRDDHEKLSQFISEIFSINLFSSIISYILFIIFLFSLDRLRQDSTILIIYSSSILLSVLAIDWVFALREDFFFISLKSITIKVLVFILSLVWVKDEGDLIKYCLINLVTTAVLYLFEFIYVRKWCLIKLSFRCNWRKHRRPILTLFSATVATSIYIRSDVIFLGWMSTESRIAFYTISVLIFTGAKHLLAGLIDISVPRFSYYIKNNDVHTYRSLWSRVFRVLIGVLMPMVTGLLLIGNDIIVVFSGEKYIEAGKSLFFLTVALIPSLIGWILVYGVLMVNGSEKKVLRCTVYGGVANVILNFFLIPIGQEVAAAITTLCAELVTMGTGIFYGRKYVSIRISVREVIGILSGCLVIVAIVLALRFLFTTVELNIWLRISLYIGFATVGYATTMIVFNTSIWKEFRKVFR